MKSVQGNKHRYHEVIERYCDVINGNTTILKTSTQESVTYKCLNDICKQTNGECKNEKYSVDGEDLWG